MGILDTVRELGIDPEDCVIREDYLVDVHGSVCISNQGLDCFPVKFGVIYGDFDCSYNKLLNLANGPDTVHGAYNCSVNQMNSLAGAPREVRDFDCSYNFLVSLKYAPRVKSRFFCGYNKLVSLEGCPGYAHEFAAHRNQLANLYGAPACDGVFDVSENPFNPGVRPGPSVTGEVRL